CSEYLAIHCTSYLSVFVLFPSSLFFLSRYPLPRDLHSFPTRRSSDLMDPQQGRSAAQWLAEAPEEEIAQVIRDYGEEKFARRMADRKSTRLNSSHVKISYAVFCLKKKKRSIDIQMHVVYQVIYMN